MKFSSREKQAIKDCLSGKTRTIDISKGNIFCQHELIEVNAEALMNELKAET